ncbi:hypothetical protein UPYG_G00112920 [Umbra pygmaea]|uniref:Uncharacterized protein n=1 Tax=Umbra pygmaea TaxID=75934 RepID=A0ABD0X399_UMBPY
MLSRLDTSELVSHPIIQIPLQRAKSLSTRHLMGYSPQQFLDERCQACQVLTFTPPEANLPWQYMGENAGGESHHSITGPWTPRASCVQHEDLQRLQDENLAFTEENQALKEENQALLGKAMLKQVWVTEAHFKSR